MKMSSFIHNPISRNSEASRFSLLCHSIDQLPPASWQACMHAYIFGEMHTKELPAYNSQYVCQDWCVKTTDTRSSHSQNLKRLDLHLNLKSGISMLRLATNTHTAITGRGHAVRNAACLPRCYWLPLLLFLSRGAQRRRNCSGLQFILVPAPPHTSRCGRSDNPLLPTSSTFSNPIRL